MTTAPTPSDAERLAGELDYLASLSLSKAAASMLRRLQADNDLLRGDYALRGAQIQRMAALIDELEGKVGRFQGVPLPLIEAINAATGSNEWQGDCSPAELLDPACREIAALVERKNACIHKLEMDALDLASENSILKRQEQAELEARKPLQAPAYRVLEAGRDIVAPEDEFLQEDATTWACDPGLIFVGMAYCRVLKPARRRVTGESS